MGPGRYSVRVVVVTIYGRSKNWRRQETEEPFSRKKLGTPTVC